MDYYNFFSFSAKKAIYRASEISQQFYNQFLDPEHIFYAILNLRSCSAVQVLQQLNINLRKLTYSLEAYLYEHAGEYRWQPSFSARTLALLDASFAEVKHLHHREIGTTHMLIALAQERSSFIRNLLSEHGLTSGQIRATFLGHLKGYTAGIEGHLKGYESGIELPPEEPEAQQTAWSGRRLTRFFPQRPATKVSINEPARRARAIRPKFHLPPEYEDAVTRRSQAVLDLAAETAATYHGLEVFPEHVLYAIVQARNCGANQLLNGLGVSFPLLRDKLALYFTTEVVRNAAKIQPIAGQRVFRVLDDAQAEARRYGHEVIGTPHLLTAILAQPDTPCLEDITGTLGLTAALIRSVLSYSPLAEEEAGPA